MQANLYEALSIEEIAKSFDLRLGDIKRQLSRRKLTLTERARLEGEGYAWAEAARILRHTKLAEPA